MRFLAGFILLLAALAGALAYGQEEEYGFLGRYDDVNRVPHNFTGPSDQFVFTRLIYNGRIPGYYKNWYTDYPRADRHLIDALKRLTNISVADEERLIPINDPDLTKYPLVYSSEIEQMVLTDDDAAILRNYLERGGFWIVDDFWGTFEWSEFETQVHKIFPHREIKDIPRNHPLFHVFYDVDHLMQVPSMAYAFNGGITWETDGFEAECKGIWDDHGRLMMVINHNTDLGDSYEWSDDPRYPNKFSHYGFRMAVNFFMYALTH